MLLALHLIASVVVFGLTFWAVISQHFHDGVLLKTGLMLLSLTSLSEAVGTMQGHYVPDPLVTFLMVGFAVVALSVLRRRACRTVWHHHKQ